MFFPYIISGVISIFVALLTIQANRSNIRAAKTETELEKNRDCCQGLAVKIAGLEARTEGTDSATKQLKEELSDIRDNMVRRADLDTLAENLGRRIDDAIRFVKG